MKIGIFAKTFSRPTIEELFLAIAGYGINSVQFNLSCVGLETLPENVPSKLVQRIAHAAEQAAVELTALSGTFNMSHPDPAVRGDGLEKFKILCETAARLRIPMITLCTGSRDPVNMWKWHPDNESKKTWDEMVQSIETALNTAKQNNLILAFEPESENIANSSSRARQLLDELGNPGLRIIIDPANLISAKRDQKEVLDEAFALLGDAIVIAHAKDRNKDFMACAAGKGLLDFEYYLQGLRKIGFYGPLIMHGLEEEEVAFSRDFLHRILEL
jgi:sugar phosphate isomerase/epimerase